MNVREKYIRRYIRIYTHAVVSLYVSRAKACVSLYHNSEVPLVRFFFKYPLKKQHTKMGILNFRFIKGVWWMEGVSVKNFGHGRNICNHHSLALWDIMFFSLISLQDLIDVAAFPFNISLTA